MAYRRVNLPVEYIGTSTDAKPVATATKTIAEGSVALESDTGVKYVYHLGQWVRQQDEESQATAEAANVAAATLAAVERIEKLLEFAVQAGGN
jgi:hypothetical protein